MNTITDISHECLNKEKNQDICTGKFLRYSTFILLLTLFSLTASSQEKSETRYVRIFSYIGTSVIFETINADVLNPVVQLQIIESDYFIGDGNLIFEKWMIKPTRWYEEDYAIQQIDDELVELWMINPFTWALSSLKRKL